MVGLERGTVELEPHDPAWRREYEAEVERLRAVAGDRLDGFEHVGSTAIPGVSAKPIVDLLAVVDDLDRAERDLVPRLTEHGYEHRPDTDVPDCLFLAKGPRERRTHYLSLTEAGSEYHREALAFRDYLRENPDVAEAYAALKRELAAEHPDDRDAYTAGKAPFVEDVLSRALDDR